MTTLWHLTHTELVEAHDLTDYDVWEMTHDDHPLVFANRDDAIAWANTEHAKDLAANPDDVMLALARWEDEDDAAWLRAPNAEEGVDPCWKVKPITLR